MKEEGLFKIPEEDLKKIKTFKEYDDYFQILYKQGIQALLKAEMQQHLGYAKNDPQGKKSGNSRNGYSGKVLKTNLGEIPLEIPRDRNATFDPVVVPKHERVAQKIEHAIVSMYSRGMSVRDIRHTIRDIYGVEVSEGSISGITDVVMEDIHLWQQRPLEPLYVVLWMDGLVVRVRQNAQVVTKTIYLMIGLTREGMKQVLGMWISEKESASFWLSALTDLKARGVKDILIACCDNLSGLRQAIRAAFPATVTQLCVVHQVRNSSKYVAWKERKAFLSDLKPVYQAINCEMAAYALDQAAIKWGQKYPWALKSWKDNWADITTYFDFPLEIRKIIYTTNTIESMNSTIRKYTREKTLFPDDQAALKAVFLAIQNLERKWTRAMKEWGLIINQLMIKFENRCTLC